jgi:hypothetical protein
MVHVHVHRNILVLHVINVFLIIMAHLVLPFVAPILHVVGMVHVILKEHVHVILALVVHHVINVHQITTIMQRIVPTV